LRFCVSFRVDTRHRMKTAKLSKKKVKIRNRDGKLEVFMPIRLTPTATMGSV